MLRVAKRKASLMRGGTGEKKNDMSRGDTTQRAHAKDSEEVRGVCAKSGGVFQPGTQTPCAERLFLPPNYLHVCLTKEVRLCALFSQSAVCTMKEDTHRHRQHRCVCQLA